MAWTLNIYCYNDIIIYWCALPLPLRPTNLKSLNLAIWFLTRAEQLRSSAEQFSSLPALSVTAVPSGTSDSMTTLNAPGSVLLDRQCVGRALHSMYGHPVRTSSPGCSAVTSLTAASVHHRSSDGGEHDDDDDEAVAAPCWSADDGPRRLFLLWSDVIRTKRISRLRRRRENSRRFFKRDIMIFFYTDRVDLSFAFRFEIMQIFKIIYRLVYMSNLRRAYFDQFLFDSFTTGWQRARRYVQGFDRIVRVRTADVSRLLLLQLLRGRTVHGSPLDDAQPDAPADERRERFDVSHQRTFADTPIGHSHYI